MSKKKLTNRDENEGKVKGSETAKTVARYICLTVALMTIALCFTGNSAHKKVKVGWDFNFLGQLESKFNYEVSDDSGNEAQQHDENISTDVGQQKNNKNRNKNNTRTEKSSDDRNSAKKR